MALCASKYSVKAPGLLNRLLPTPAKIYCNQNILKGEPKTTAARYFLKEILVRPAPKSRNLKAKSGVALNIKSQKNVTLPNLPSRFIVLALSDLSTKSRPKERAR